MEYYSAIKNNEILPFAIMWMELQCIMLSDKSVRERQISYDFTHMWNLRNKTNEQREKKERHRETRNRLLIIENRLVVAGGEVGGDG